VVSPRAEAAPASRRASRRGRARAAALQMLYQCEVGRLPIAQVRDTFWLQGSDDGRSVSDELRMLAIRLAEGVVATTAGLDSLIVNAAEHWRIERMNVMDRLILRLALYELIHEPETPFKVIINEALELARVYSGDESVGFVNGMLDALRRKLERT
jgi:N utilization substance protein B